MRIAVVGPGAMGCFFAARLSLHSGHEVWLLDHDRGRAEVLGAKGLQLIEDGKVFSAKVRVASSPEKIGHADLLLLCVKSHDVSSAIDLVRSLASRDNLLLAFQNGIAHHRVLQEKYPWCWAVGVTAQGATLEDAGVVRHGGAGETAIGTIREVGGPSHLLEKSAQVLTGAGIPTLVSADIQTQVWKKFIVNIGINALTVILNCSNGLILDSPEGATRLVKAVGEAAVVAEAKGIEIGVDPVAMTQAVCESTSNNISSMLQDVRRQKKTEIDAINGALLHEAVLLGISLPENERLVREVKAIEAGYLFS